MSTLGETPGDSRQARSDTIGVMTRDEADGRANHRRSYGWPCEAVFAPPHGECRYLRGMVEEQFRPGDFAPYCSQFPSGPFKLEPKMAKAIMDSFEHAGGPL